MVLVIPEFMRCQWCKKNLTKPYMRLDANSIIATKYSSICNQTEGGGLQVGHDSVIVSLLRVAAINDMTQTTEG